MGVIKSTHSDQVHANSCNYLFVSPSARCGTPRVHAALAWCLQSEAYSRSHWPTRSRFGPAGRSAPRVVAACSETASARPSQARVPPPHAPLPRRGSITRTPPAPPRCRLPLGHGRLPSPRTRRAGRPRVPRGAPPLRVGDCLPADAGVRPGAVAVRRYAGGEDPAGGPAAMGEATGGMDEAAIKALLRRLQAEPENKYVMGCAPEGGVALAGRCGGAALFRRCPSFVGAFGGLSDTPGVPSVRCFAGAPLSSGLALSCSVAFPLLTL